MSIQCGVHELAQPGNCTEVNTTLSLSAEVLLSLGIDEETPKYGVVVELYIIGVLCLIGIIGNLLSVIGLRRDKERRETLFLLQCLAVMHLLFVTTAIFRYPLKHLIDKHKYEYIQLGAFPLLKSFQTICIWTMVLVTIDRYIYVCHPLRAQMLFTHRSKRIWVCGITVAGFAYNLPRFFDSCITLFVIPCSDIAVGGMMFRPEFHHKAYYVVYRHVLYIILLYAVPLSILAFMNYRLIKAIHYSRKRHANCAHSSRAQDPTHDSNATTVLIIIVIAFMVCESPEPVIHTISSIETGLEVKLFTFDYLPFYTASSLFMIISASINFVIYLVFGQRFRHILLQLFRDSFTAATSKFTRDTVQLQYLTGRHNPAQPEVYLMNNHVYHGVK